MGVESAIGSAIENLKRVNGDFEQKSPREALRWAIDLFSPDISFACSYGADDMVILDMIAKINPKTKVFYLDTDVLFKETYELIEQAAERYGIRAVPYAGISLGQQARLYGETLWNVNPDLCCEQRKVKPLLEALKGQRAWITGIRRDQTPTRATAGIVEWDPKFNLVKINPLAPWTKEMVWDYIRANHVPYNPLHDQGYPSIGCTHCTSLVKPGEDPRSGRWKGFKKDECGLHCDTGTVPPKSGAGGSASVTPASDPRST